MRIFSKKRRKLNDDCRPFRISLVERVGRCEVCGHSPKLPWRTKPYELSQLAVHEICRGRNRSKALDKPFAVLVLCAWCNCHVLTSAREWPEARQLAVLKRKRTMDYDLEAYNKLVNPNAPKRILESEVKSYLTP